MLGIEGSGCAGEASRRHGAINRSRPAQAIFNSRGAAPPERARPSSAGDRCKGLVSAALRGDGLPRRNRPVRGDQQLGWASTIRAR